MIICGQRTSSPAGDDHLRPENIISSRKYEDKSMRTRRIMPRTACLPTGAGYTKSVFKAFISKKRKEICSAM
jgi:hypothetical protein